MISTGTFVRSTSACTRVFMRRPSPLHTLYAAPPWPSDRHRLIRAHGVAHVGQIALRVEVADAQVRLGAPGLDDRQLPRDAGRDERRRLPRTDVIERPRDDDVETIESGGAEGKRFLRQLADGVGAGRLELESSLDRMVFRLGRPAPIR